MPASSRAPRTRPPRSNFPRGSGEGLAIAEQICLRVLADQVGVRDLLGDRAAQRPESWLLPWPPRIRARWPAFERRRGATSVLATFVALASFT